MNKYNQAPLPFQGQKRRFAKAFKLSLNEFEKNATYIDLFGGSGLLAHTVKSHYPSARVIWNDYDNYLERLRAIPETNSLLAHLRALTSELPRKDRIPLPVCKSLLNLIKSHLEQYKYLDYITISASLLFSGKYVMDLDQLSKETFYNKVKVTDYDATGYLEGVERVRSDYKELFHATKGGNVVYLVDPPYLSTDVSTYNSKDYWRLQDYLDVLNVLDGSKYFYFTSNKSQIIELCEWMETRTFSGNPFAGATMSSTSVRLNKTSSYTDIMLYKRSPD